MVVRLDSLAAGGEAVGRDDAGRVVFVDGGVPGDLVEVELAESRKRFARGRIARLIEPGDARVAPPCPIAERCGGCPWQAVAGDAQAAAKEAIVRRALRTLAVEVAPIVAAPSALGYRVRATLHARDGVVGFFARRSHALVAVERCLALEPALDRALAAARALEGGALAAALGEDGALRGTVTPRGEVHLQLVAGRGADAARLDALAGALVACGVAAGALVGARAYGAAELDAGEPDAPHLVSAAGFRQADHAQNARLRALVLAALEPDGREVLELYAGDGNFTRDLHRRAARVVAVEEDAAAVARLRRAMGGVEAVVARVEVDVVARAARGERWSRVLLDPPRAGAADALAAIAAVAGERIVYVSCDPATLARDAAALAARGWRALGATPVDLMPHTDHVEVVLTLVRGG